LLLFVPPIDFLQQARQVSALFIGGYAEYAVAPVTMIAGKALNTHSLLI